MKKIGYCLAGYLLINSTMVLSVGAGVEDDVLRRDATQALVNYQARLAEAERRHNLTIPPGTDDAIKTGEYMSLMEPKVENIGIEYINDEFYESLFKPRSKKDYFDGYYKHLLKRDKPDVNVLRFLKTRQIEVKDAGFQAQLIRNIVQPFTDDSDVMSEGLREKLKELELAKDAKNTTPYKKEDFDKSDGNGLTADEKNELINFVVSQTSYSAAYASLYELLSKRVVDPSATQITGQHKSLLEAMHVESTRRVQSPEWYQEIAVMPTDSLLRELAHIEAFQLWLQYQQYRQQELNQFMLASLMSQIQRVTSSMDTYVQGSRDAAKTDSVADNPT
jgi:hypothetical protein